MTTKCSYELSEMLIRPLNLMCSARVPRKFKKVSGFILMHDMILCSFGSEIANPSFEVILCILSCIDKLKSQLNVMRAFKNLTKQMEPNVIWQRSAIKLSQFCCALMEVLIKSFNYDKMVIKEMECWWSYQIYANHVFILISTSAKQLLIFSAIFHLFVFVFFC